MENNNQQATSPEVNQQNVQYIQQKEALPNSTAVLVLGILSLVICFYGLGAIMAIIALALGKNSNSLYLNNKDKYSAGSYNNFKAGKVCAIIGLSIGGIWLVFILIGILGLIGSGISNM